LTATARPNDRVNLSIAISDGDVRLAAGDFERVLSRVWIGYAFTSRIFVQALTRYANRSETMAANVLSDGMAHRDAAPRVYNEDRIRSDGSELATRVLAMKLTRDIDLR
jgi:hypothetical protein